MSTTTDKLALFKYDPSTDGAQTFNIQKALNENWDKLDDAVKEILITLANKAPATHAAQHAKGGADPITPKIIGAIGYDAEQSLSNKEKGQARGNISALNGQFLLAKSAGGKIGWYRITKPFSYYSTDGYLTVSHAWANGGASELLLGVSSTPDTHGKLQCLRCIGQINSVPYISNARLVQVDRSTLALDLYVSGAGTNDWDLQLCNCGHNSIELTSPTFISADDTLPSGETLAAVMEYQNPPMLLGVEYKTMERYLGKPVYTLAFDIGALPASGYKILYAPAAANISDIVAYGGYTNGGTAFPCLTAEGCSNGVSPYDIRCAAVKNMSGGIAVSIGVSKDRSAETATVWVKYTKNTE